MAKEIYREFQGEGKKLIYVQQTFFSSSAQTLVSNRCSLALETIPTVGARTFLSLAALITLRGGRNYLANSNTFQPRKMFPTMSSSRYRFRRRGA